MPKDWPEDGKRNPSNPNPATPDPATPQPATDGTPAWKKNIDWVFNPDAKADFLDAYEGVNNHIQDWFRNNNWHHGHKNAFYAVRYAQRHNDGAASSITQHPSEAITYLRSLGYRADL